MVEGIALHTCLCRWKRRSIAINRSRLIALTPLRPISGPEGSASHASLIVCSRFGPTDTKRIGTPVNSSSLRI